MSANVVKIFNDPVYGFISIPYRIIIDLIDHPYYQRLRRIKQLGMAHIVYPGALHTRFHHALGAMHLMQQAIEVIRQKGIEITEEEAKGVCVAILLHDIGHGPFSHALEHTIVHQVSHEDISSLFMERLNQEFGGELDLAIEIFNNRYHKKFLHQLVSSQLDMDRLDYLKRDSFYTGVSEGVISSGRIIKMLTVVDDELAIEEKGIYSIEKFIIARRLMYWQVYLHKTVLSGEHLLINTLKRAKALAEGGEELFASGALRRFLYNRYGKEDFESNSEILESFSNLDDSDIYCSIKEWALHEDKILSILSKNLLGRKLFKTVISKKSFNPESIQRLKELVAEDYGISMEDVGYFVVNGTIINNAYNPASDKIKIYFKNGSTQDIADASDNLNISTLSKPVEKNFICFPKNHVNNFILE
jgi:uncharacterized protein